MLLKTSQLIELIKINNNNNNNEYRNGVVTINMKTFKDLRT